MVGACLIAVTSGTDVVCAGAVLAGTTAGAASPLPAVCKALLPPLPLLPLLPPHPPIASASAEAISLAYALLLLNLKFMMDSSEK